MGVESALYDHLRTSGPVAELVGTSIYPVNAPVSVPVPRIIYQKISESKAEHTGGACGLTSCLFQFSCWADNELQAVAISQAVRNRIHGFHGAMGAELLYVHAVLFDGSTDQVEPPDDGSDNYLYARQETYRVISKETIPTLL